MADEPQQRILKGARFSEVVLDPAVAPLPGRPSPQVVTGRPGGTDPRAMVGGKILGVAQDAHGLTVTVELPEEPPRPG